MSEFQTVARVGDIPTGEGRAFPVDGAMVAVFNREEVYTAINDTCPHMGASLSCGWLDGDGIVCPWHAWKFSVVDGTWLDNPKSKINLDSYEVRVEGDEIQVRVSPSEKQSTYGSSQPS